MNGDVVSAETAGSVAGHNRVSTQALTAVARGVAADVLGAEPHRVRAGWGDENGLLALTLTVTLPIPALTTVVSNPDVLEDFGGPILQRARDAQPKISEEITRLTGSRLSRVDIRVAGVAPRIHGRVR